nr:hypothetical protein [Pandoravirus belohorizontensis]
MTYDAAVGDHLFAEYSNGESRHAIISVRKGVTYATFLQEPPSGPGGAGCYAEALLTNWTTNAHRVFRITTDKDVDGADCEQAAIEERDKADPVPWSEEYTDETFAFFCQTGLRLDQPHAS